ncbi:MAG: hypothetical protein JG776_1216 [Caloramator sp.]|jgi:hypothetical protein|uniref:YlxR domain-containing protein n=1 Tax=Caloramator proteoclasticus DSM 10124 TaxID=1121262 RepID=A0A1M4SMC0_9CLOT|nr:MULTISPECIES: YlxR family protein [Caloramator]MBZ4663508.1 hypothetical protein [Caloramator sp.]SHE33302.1 hypothetical protein SAMN02746091_00168 [Caloramator proteoclasticus DSM 10124]
MKVKKIPQRMCLGCMQMKPKKELIRVVRNKEGEVNLDLTGKAPGRGAYICRNVECFEKAYKAKKFERALEVTISPEVYEKLKEELESGQ